MIHSGDNSILQVAVRGDEIALAALDLVEKDVVK